MPPRTETSTLTARLVWHQLVRRNKDLGLEARVLNFAPAALGTFEVMFVEIKNVSKRPLEITATSAIPLFARSADNLRDHRHVTSLLHRIALETYGLHVHPTMAF